MSLENVPSSQQCISGLVIQKVLRASLMGMPSASWHIFIMASGTRTLLAYSRSLNIRRVQKSISKRVYNIRTIDSRQYDNVCFQALGDDVQNIHLIMYRTFKT